MAHPSAPKVNLVFLALLVVGGAGLVGLFGCAGSRLCQESPARVSLEKKIFSLEDQIEVQKRKILSLQGELTHRKPNPVLEESMGETLADSSFESMNTYYEAISLRDAGKYDEAVEKLNRFILENPDHVYSDRAQFLILDSHFKNREYGLALVDSFLLENRYTDSRKIPEAIHKRALAYLNLGDKEKGAQTLKILVETFPNSAVLPSAKETLASLQPSETQP
jgi:TolA-binding protein